MAHTWLPKAIYYRETTGGKTRWVKIPNIEIMSGTDGSTLFIDPEAWTKDTKGCYVPSQFVYRSGVIR